MTHSLITIHSPTISVSFNGLLIKDHDSTWKNRIFEQQISTCTYRKHDIFEWEVNTEHFPGYEKVFFLIGCVSFVYT